MAFKSKQDQKVYDAKRYRADRERRREISRRNNLKKLGLTIDEYEVIYFKQDGKCALCGQPETQKINGKVKLLAADHNHITNKVRGLLCFSCNTGLGRLGDTTESLKRAINYLETYG